jgi:hypothetical protein
VQRLHLRASELSTSSRQQRAWRLTFDSTKAGAAFEVVLNVPANMNPDSALAITHGVLRRVSGGDGAAFLYSLARAFGADSVPRAAVPADSLMLDVGFLGTRLSHSSGKWVYAGEFTSAPPGNWIVTKLFLAAGQAEVFLAIEPTTGEAQLIAKDPDSANGVVAEFARLF